MHEDDEVQKPTVGNLNIPLTTVIAVAVSVIGTLFASEWLVAPAKTTDLQVIDARLDGIEARLKVINDWQAVIDTRRFENRERIVILENRLDGIKSNVDFLLRRRSGSLEEAPAAFPTGTSPQ